MKFKWMIAPKYRWISGYHFTPPIHDGVDYGTPTGADYTSPQDGIVKIARFTLAQNVTGQQYGYGNYLQIDHGSGWVSLGAHLLEGYVRVGEAVKVGQLVAKTDNTGWSSGPHLHFTLKENGSPRDPALYLFDDVEPPPPPIEFEIPIIPVLPRYKIVSDSLTLRSLPYVSTKTRITMLNKDEQFFVSATYKDGSGNIWFAVMDDDGDPMMRLGWVAAHYGGETWLESVK